MSAMSLRKIVTSILFVALGAGSSVAEETWVVRMVGVGPVKIGMKLPEINSLLQETFALPKDKDEQSCFYVTPEKHAHVAFMMVDGVLARVDVDSAGVPTAEGVQVGDTEAQALKVYGTKMKVEPHKYTGPEGHYLTVKSSSGKYGFRFETDRGKITRFYAGKFETVQYVEGCG